MKNSGIEWIGQIPDSWNARKLKSICQIYGRIGFRGYKADDLVAQGGGAITFSPSNLKEMKMDYSKCSYLSWEKYFESPEIQVNKGDILFVKTGSSFGKVAIVDDLPEKATINPQLIVVKDIKIDRHFLVYFFTTTIIRAQVDCSVVGGTIPTISQEKISNYWLIVPQIEEQRKIVSYLDVKCAKIDKLIEVQQAQIEKLKEYKQSVITEAVTKGLNPTAPMKDSGVEWIGKIPEDWELIKIGSLFACRNEKVSDSEFSPLSVSRGGIVPQMENVAKSDAGDNRKLVLKNDFVINSRSDRKQSCGVSPLDGSVSLINTVLYPIAANVIIPEYVNIVMKNYGFAEEFYRWGHGIVADLWTTRWQEMKSIVLPIPSIEIQKQIVKTLSKRIDTINTLIALKQSKIEKLQEYKKSLIYEYVTGKKEIV